MSLKSGMTIFTCDAILTPGEAPCSTVLIVPDKDVDSNRKVEFTLSVSHWLETMRLGTIIHNCPIHSESMRLAYSRHEKARAERPEREER